jgi:hypothetical protein
MMKFHFQRASCTLNTEGVGKFQPGATPWVKDVLQTRKRTLKVFALPFEPFQGSIQLLRSITQGVALGSN